MVRTDGSTMNGPDDSGDSPSPSGEPGEAEGGQPPDLKGNLRREDALTGVTNDCPKHRMSFC